MSGNGPTAGGNPGRSEPRPRPRRPGAPAAPPAPPAPPAGLRERRPRPAPPPHRGPRRLPRPPGPPVSPARAARGTSGVPGAPAVARRPRDGRGGPGPGATAPGASTAGSGAILTFAVKAIKQVERKTLVFEYHRQQAVTRQYAPQSLIGMMLDDLTGPGHFLEVDLDDPFFRSIDVEVSIMTAFEPIGLQSVAVALDYGDAAHPQKHRHDDLVFDATRTQPQHWIVPIANGLRPRLPPEDRVPLRPAERTGMPSATRSSWSPAASRTARCSSTRRST